MLSVGVSDFTELLISLGQKHGNSMDQASLLGTSASLLYSNKCLTACLLEVGIPTIVWGDARGHLDIVEARSRSQVLLLLRCWQCRFSQGLWPDNEDLRM